MGQTVGQGAGRRTAATLERMDLFAAPVIKEVTTMVSDVRVPPLPRQMRWNGQ
jgi:hypothetical protein